MAEQRLNTCPECGAEDCPINDINDAGLGGQCPGCGRIIWTHHVKLRGIYLGQK